MARTISVPRPTVSAWFPFINDEVDIALRNAGVERTHGDGFGTVRQDRDGQPGTLLTTSTPYGLAKLVEVVQAAYPGVDPRLLR